MNSRLSLKVAIKSGERNFQFNYHKKGSRDAIVSIKASQERLLEHTTNDLKTKHNFHKKSSGGRL